MNAQVLTTRTSASSGRDVISIPRCKTLPSMISASTRFLAQPRLIMPTFVARCRRVNGSSFATETAAATARELTTSSIDRHVFVVQMEEHTSELQSQSNLVCRLLLEKKKKNLRRFGHC